MARYAQFINSGADVAENLGKLSASFSAIRSSIVLMARVEPLDKDIDVVDEATDVVGVKAGTFDVVDDVFTTGVGAVGLAAALIALRTDVRVLRVEGIVKLNEYLKYTKIK